MTQEKDEFPGLLQDVRGKFALVQDDRPLFLTDVQGLWLVFLNNIPQRLRQHYTCNSCRHFVERYGSLVYVNSDGTLTSPLWSACSNDEFASAFQRMNKEATRKDLRITELLVTSALALGTESNKDGTVTPPKIWTHFSVPIPAARRYKGMVDSADQYAAKRKELVRVVSVALSEFDLSNLQKGLTILETGNLYRADRVLGQLKWFMELKVRLQTLEGARQKDAVVWDTVTRAPEGFCRIKSSALGRYLECVVAGDTVEVIKAKFEALMDPTVFNRPQAAPSQGLLDRAEKIMSQMQSAHALSRRYARIEDIPNDEFIWKDGGTSTQKEATPKLFAGIRTKAGTTDTPVEIPNAQKITWDKFQRTVLPRVRKMSAQVQQDRFVALVTAVDPSAPSILAWPNGVSWSYPTGVDGEIRKRLKDAGAMFTGTDIRISLMWDNRNDLDLHVTTPGGETIYYGNKKSRCGGALDVDRNVNGETMTPIENTRWPAGKALSGRYKVYVHLYSTHGDFGPDTPFVVELEVGGTVRRFQGKTTSSDRKQHVCTFDYAGVDTRIEGGAIQSGKSSNWNIPNGSWAEVTGITTSPNLWSETKRPHFGEHTIFLLKDCKDMDNVSRPFLPEMLASEYHEIRRALDAYASNNPPVERDLSTASGIGFVKDQEWNLCVKVELDNGARALYKIERFD